MSAYSPTTNSISYTDVDIPGYAVVPVPEEIPRTPTSDVKTQKASKVLEELDPEEATKFHIAPLGLNNFLYNAAHLFLPYFYSSRAYVVLSSATLTEEEIRSQFSEAVSKDSRITLKHWPEVKKSWTEFLDSLSNEWKTLNVVSALLLTAIYNVLQLGGRGNNLTQSTALMSLLSALMSLLFGCLYLIRFETMRRTYKAIQWSSDVLETSQTVFWNIYILLALPSVWLAWSLIFFVACLMSIVWQPIDDTIRSTSGLGPLHLATKIAVSVLLLVGMAHLSLALFTFARYGSRLDKTWTNKLAGFSGAIRPLADVEATSKSSGFEDNRAPFPPFLLPPFPLWPSPYVATVGSGRRPMSPYPHLPSSPYRGTVGEPFDSARPAYPHLPSSPYRGTVGGPFDSARPAYPYLPSSPYPVPLDRPFHNNGTPYSRLLSSPYASPYGHYSTGRPSDNSRPRNNSRPLNESRSMNNSRAIDHSEHVNHNGPVDNTANGPVDNSRPNGPDRRVLNSTMAYSSPWNRIGPVRYGNFITRPPSAP